MANNTFVTLTVPDSLGVGPPALIEELAPSPSLVVDGPAEDKTTELVIEVTEDGTHYAPVTDIFPIHNPPGKTLPGLVGLLARVRRMSGSGPAFVALGSGETSANEFFPLSTSPTPTDAMGPFKTLIVTGKYTKPVVIEGSEDGIHFDAVASFDTFDTGSLSIYGTWAAMRVRPGSGSPESVAIGGGFAAGSSVGPSVKALVPGAGIDIEPPSGTGVVQVGNVYGSDIQPVGPRSFEGVEDASARADHVHGAGFGSIIPNGIPNGFIIDQNSFTPGPQPGVVAFPFPDTMPPNACFVTVFVTVDQTMQDGVPTVFSATIGYGVVGAPTNNFFAPSFQIDTTAQPVPFRPATDASMKVGSTFFDGSNNPIVPQVYITVPNAVEPTQGLFTVKLFYFVA